MKILIVQQKMLGDVLVSSLLCENLRKAFPNAQIDYMVYEFTAPVLKGHTSFDNLILFKEEHRKSKIELYKLLKTIRKTKYDILIDAYSKLESWLITLVSGAPMKISYSKKSMGFLYTDTVERRKKASSNLGLIIENRLSLLDPLGLKFPLLNFPKIFVFQEEREYANDTFTQHKVAPKKKTIMLNILGSSEEKTYPLRYLAEAANFIAGKKDVNILLNYHPDKRAEAVTFLNFCTKRTQEMIFPNILGETIRELIAIMNNCDLIVGNDGGAINIAKALNKPTFTIFSPWIDKEGWATFEDGINHVSVHLKDFEPQIFEAIPKKSIKTEYMFLYNRFVPSNFIPLLNRFLKTHLEF